MSFESRTYHLVRFTLIAPSKIHFVILCIHHLTRDLRSSAQNHHSSFNNQHQFHTSFISIAGRNRFELLVHSLIDFKNSNMHKGDNKSFMIRRGSRKEEMLEAEVKRLREELNKANLEKSEISSEYEKLTTICRSQRQQLHGIKQALASTATPNTQPQGLFNKSSSSPDQNSWQAFPEDQKTPTLVSSENSKPVTTKKSPQNRSGAMVPAIRSPITVPITNLNQSQRFGGLKNDERNLASQPPGWAAF